MLHYKMCFEFSGPLSNMSAIRREAKHSGFKRAAPVSASQVNPCLTFALDAQKAFAQFIASKNQRCDDSR